MRDFAHLHVHTKYSVKDASASPEDYVHFIHKYHEENPNAGRITGLAITEHGQMFSMVEAYKACTTPNDKGETVKNIIGCEVYHCEDRSTDLNSRYHMVLLAKNDIGLVNLYQIVSDGGLHPLKGKTKDFPRTHDKAFEKFGEGIIATSACLGGIIPKLLVEGKYEEAKQKALYYNSIFEEFYLEVQTHELADQLLVNSYLVKMSQETGIELVITTDAHYVTQADRKYHEILKAMAVDEPWP